MMERALPRGTEPYYVTVFIDRLNGRGEIPVGVLLVDPAQDTLYVRMQDNWEAVADEDAIEVLSGLGEMFMERAAEQGTARLVADLLQSASNYVRLGEPRTLPPPHDFRSEVDRLYTEHVTGAQG